MPKKPRGSLLTMVANATSELPTIQRRIAKFVVANPTTAVRMSISELAKRTGAKSEASIVKFYRQFGFSGYHDFKVSLATEIAGSVFHHADEDADIRTGDDLPTIKRKIFVSAMQLLKRNLDLENHAELQTIVALLREASRIVILGFGTSSVVASDAFIKFSRLGMNCLYTPDSHASALILAEPRDGDLVFCISYSGESRDVVEQAGMAKPRAKIVAMTGNSGSPLGKVADVCLTVNSVETTYRTDAMVSRIVQIALVDTVFAALAISMGDAGLARLTQSRQGLSYLKY